MKKQPKKINEPNGMLIKPILNRLKSVDVALIEVIRRLYRCRQNK